MKSAPLAKGDLAPIGFEPNAGQLRGPGSSRVRFRARGRGATLYVTGDGAILSLGPAAGRELLPVRGRLALTPSLLDHPWGNGRGTPRLSRAGAVVRMKLVGTRPWSEEVGLEELPGRSNYFIGNDPRHWITGVKRYAKVKASGVYPGVDLVYYGNQGKLEYDFVVSPGADPRVIRLRLEDVSQGEPGGPGGKIRTDAGGNLVLELTSGGDSQPEPDGEVRFPRPLIYQPRVEGRAAAGAGQTRDFVEGRWLVAGDEAGFKLGAYDRSRELVIDPVLSYSTYLGGSAGPDFGQAIAVDAAGSAYLTGTTCSTDFPVASGFEPVNASGGCQDAFVTKLNALGQLVYSTYLGGSASDAGNGITVDAGGDAYVTGITCSTDFPVIYSFQAAQGGGCDAFVTKLNAAGDGLVYSTYLGGTGGDGGYGIAVDSQGSAYVTGVTVSPDFPVTPGAFQTTYGGGACANVPGPPAIAPLEARAELSLPPCPDAFVAKLNASGSALVYSTYLGGTSDDRGSAIAADSEGNAYVTGTTCSTDFPTRNPIQAANASGGCRDAFAAKLNATGTTLVYSTYLGGKDADTGQGVAVDGLGEAYVAGITHSTDFPAANAFQSANAGGADAFITKFNSSGSGIVYSTYLGGSSDDFPFAITVDAAGDAFLAGQTFSSDFPLLDPLQPALAGSFDAFVAALAPTGDALLYSTYLGGSGGEGANGIALDSAGGVYITGSTYSADWPATSGAFQNACRSIDPADPAFCAASEVFAAKLGPLDVPGAALSTSSINFGGLPPGTISAPRTVVLRNVGSKPLTLGRVLVAPHTAFAETHSCGASVPPGSSCVFHVTFKAGSKGAAKGYLILIDNGSPAGLQFVRLAGVGM